MIIEWKRKPESDLHWAQVGDITLEQTWDGVKIKADQKQVFIPISQYDEDRLSRELSALSS